MSGKNLGTNGIGPNMGGVSPLGLASLSRRSRRAARILRRMMLIAIPKQNKLNAPTLPPIAPANVATSFFLSCLWKKQTNIRILQETSSTEGNPSHYQCLLSSMGCRVSSGSVCVDQTTK